MLIIPHVTGSGKTQLENKLAASVTSE